MTASVRTSARIAKELCGIDILLHHTSFLRTIRNFKSTWVTDIGQKFRERDTLILSDQRKRRQGFPSTPVEYITVRGIAQYAEGDLKYE